MPSPALILVALAAATPSPADQEFDLPPALVEVEAMPAAPPVAPITPAVVAAPSPEPTRRVITVTPVPEREAPYLIEGVPWLESGSGTLTLRATGMAGHFATLVSAGVGVALHRFHAGLTFTTGGNDLVGLTHFGVRGGARLATFGRVDLTAAIDLAVGAASTTLLEAPTSTAVIAFQPEVGARLQLLPWARAHATLGYRMIDAADWKGPEGDALGGLEAGVGLEFGDF